MIRSQRHLFDIPADIAYLNCAYLSPLMEPVLAAGRAGLERKRHPWTIVRRDFHDEVETARACFARLIGATADDIAIISSTSYGVATASCNLPLLASQNVVLLAEEHASNTYEWVRRAREVGAQLRVIVRPQDGDWTSAVLDRIDTASGIVALPAVHWTDGGRIDLAAIGARCREVGSAFVVDGTQSIGAAPFDVTTVKPDFLCCSAYKWLMCPYTLAFLYAAPAHHQGRPLEQHEFVRAGVREREGETGWSFEFQAGARRYDMGERSNFVSLPMAITAIEQLLAWTPAAIATTLSGLIEEVAELAKDAGLATPPAASRSPHMIGLRSSGSFSKQTAVQLAERGVEVSFRGGALRVSPHLYNDRGDVERLFSALADLR